MCIQFIYISYFVLNFQVLFWTFKVDECFSLSSLLLLSDDSKVGVCVPSPLELKDILLLGFSPLDMLTTQAAVMVTCAAQSEPGQLFYGVYNINHVGTSAHMRELLPLSLHMSLSC